MAAFGHHVSQTDIHTKNGVVWTAARHRLMSYGRGIQKGGAGFDAGSESSFSSLDQTSLCIQTSVVIEKEGKLQSVPVGA